MPKTELTPFEQALLDASLEEFADIPSEAEIDVEPSAAFEGRCEEMIEKDRRGKLRVLSTAVRRAILIAAIIAALATTVMAVPSIRRAIIEFFAQDTGSYYEFSFDQEMAATAPEYIEKVYEVTYVPRGFKEDTVSIDFGSVVYIWTMPNGDSISFDQYPIPNDSEGPAPNAENVTTETRNIDGYEVFVVHTHGNTIFYWTDNEYFFQLYFSESVSEKDQIKVFKSIELNDDAIIPEY